MVEARGFDVGILEADGPLPWVKGISESRRLKQVGKTEETRNRVEGSSRGEVVSCGGYFDAITMYVIRSFLAWIIYL